MKIKEKLSYQNKSKPLTITADKLVADALDIMCEKNIGSIVVVDDAQKVQGILTERDMMKRVLHPKKDPHTTRIQDVMTSNIRCATEEDQLVDWLRIMSSERFRHLPVVDDSGTLINVISQGDFVAYTWPDLFEKTKDDLKKRVKKPFQLIFLLLSITIIIALFLTQ